MKKYALVALLFASCNSSREITTTRIQESVAHVLEYTPAPGQFINEPQSGFQGVTTPAAACAYAEQRMAARDYVSLGGWGGYIVAAFAEPVPASEEYELYVVSNSMLTSSEPGVVWVMEDTNGNGAADDNWYELRGSEYVTSTHGYRVTYTDPDTPFTAVPWTDNQGGSGTIGRIIEHGQADYFPLWIEGGQLSFEGVLLPTNITEETVENTNSWIAQPLAWGYADNFSSLDGRGSTNYFRISNAVTATGQPAKLARVHFIKVQTGVNAWRTRIGEISTEVYGIGCFRTVSTEN